MGAPPTPLTPGQPGPLLPGEFTGASQPQVVSFLLKNVTPPSLLYVQRDDQLACAVMSSVAAEFVTVTARLLLAQEGRVTTVQFVVRTTATYSVASLQVPLAEGYLLSLVVTPNLSTLSGQTYATVFINRGPTVSLAGAPGQILVASYVTQVSPGAWPAGVRMLPTDGPGNPRFVQPPNPGAGSEINQSPNANAVWELIAFGATFTTSVAVATRNIALKILFSGFTVWKADALAGVAASTTVQVSGFPAQATSTLVATDIEIPFPIRTLLPSGASFGTVTGNLQAGDAYTNITVYVREWLVL